MTNEKIVTAKFYCKTHNTTSVSYRKDGSFSIKTWFKHTSCEIEERKV